MAKKKTAKRSTKKKSSKLTVETITHGDDKRSNIPTAEMSSVMEKGEKYVKQLRYPRNPDLDPQLVWRGKDQQDWSDLVVNAPPLYIQEKVHPKVLIDDLLKETKKQDDRDDRQGDGVQMNLFGDFNGVPSGDAKTEFYQHEANWTNRMILGDSLQVMASLAEREGLRGKVQCIYIDPPYGIKFNSNFQWSTTSRDVKDGKSDHITREPEQVKAFRDTWRDGIHSYLTYLRDRLTVARDLLSESGSIFVQIGDENVHRVRALLDEVMGESNYISQIAFQKSGGSSSAGVETITDFLLWYGKNKLVTKMRKVLLPKEEGKNFERDYRYVEDELGVPADDTGDDKRRFRLAPANSQDKSATRTCNIPIYGEFFHPGANRHWSIDPDKLVFISKATERLSPRKRSLYYKRYSDEASGDTLKNVWMDTAMAGLTVDKIYVVQTAPKVVQRCILLTTDPGDLVLDPACGSGTTAYVAEQWGRRWLTVDTSRVALALTRARIMGARYQWYLLADSPEGQKKEATLTRSSFLSTLTSNNIRKGFVYERVPHVSLKNISDNFELETIWEKLQPNVETARIALNKSLNGFKVPFKVLSGGRRGAVIDFESKGVVSLPNGEVAPSNGFMEWEVPNTPEPDWPESAKVAFGKFWEAKKRRLAEINASIAAKADFEYLYDRPYEDKSKVRVAGPFTVESLSPHRTLGVDHDDELIDPLKQKSQTTSEGTDFATMVLDNLKKAGVQQSNKVDKINFDSIELWPGNYICAQGRYISEEGESKGVEQKAGIFVGPEFGTVTREDLVSAARECGEANFDVLVTCAFNYEAHASDFNKLGRVQVLKARMNADLHMAGELANTGKGNLFVIFGEPDIDITEVDDGMIQVKINGVDVFHPNTGEVRSDDTDGIACWFIDTDYNEESFFVRHAYFLGAGDPYKSLKTTLKAEINEEAWDSLNSDTSRPFNKPKSKRIAVKVINHLGDEVMKVFRVE